MHSTDERSRSLRRQRVQVRKSPAPDKQSAPVVDELKGGDYNGSQLQGSTAYMISDDDGRDKIRPLPRAYH